MHPVLLTKMEYGKYCEVKFENGKIYRRVVRYSKPYGLYIVVAKTRYYKKSMIVEPRLGKE